MQIFPHRSGMDGCQSRPLNDTANLVQEVVEAVQQALLPDDGTSDPTTDILQQVVNSASATTTTQQQLLQQIVNLQQTVSQMQLQLSGQQEQSGGGGRGGGNRGGGYQGRGRGTGRGTGRGFLRYPRRYNLYCWTHGGCGHLGASCRDKQQGHQDEATFVNKMAGNVANCPAGNITPAAGWTPPTQTA